MFVPTLRVVVLAVAIAASGCQPQTPSVTSQPAAADETWQGAIVLGSPSLTAGIPSGGSLNLGDIRQWLANPANHEPLRIALPLGLRASEPRQLSEPLTRAKIELGRQLFFERRLSRAGTLCCADCHHPGRHFTSDEIAHRNLRETAVSFNRILGQEQFWDGRAKSLEEQIRFPLENVHEMKTTAADCVARLAQIEGYRLQFVAIFGQVDFESMCAALAAFERALVTGPSAWDYDVELRRLQQVDSQSLTADDQTWLAKVEAAATQNPLSSAARRGAELFFSERTGCANCHSGPNFTDEQYHNVGLRPRGPANSPLGEKAAEDLGRFHVTKNEADRRAFKTPTLRNVAHTWPYFHDGRYHKLQEVVEHFVRGGDEANSSLQELDLSPEEVQDLVAFLESLSGDLPRVAHDRLPP
jgi:cytochrome c peroxidase